MRNFQDIGIPTDLTDVLARQNIVNPTEIQELSIPFVLRGDDILASAQTGTGKTLSFALPIVMSLKVKGYKKTLILSPTRELATQITKAILSLLDNVDKFKVALLIGGEPKTRQEKALRKQPQIIVATPGRVIDHIQSGSLMLNNTTRLVLDETDKMLEMGFIEQLNEIQKYLPKHRQTLLFSATISKNVEAVANRYLNNPKRINAHGTHVNHNQIKQEKIFVEDKDRFKHLLVELSSREGSVVIFVRTKTFTEKLVKMLKGEGYRSAAIHGDLRQSRRARVLTNFREQRVRILVATDVASRGIDIPHIEHVINYHLPQTPEDYVHRVGRTGRAGASGNALSLVSRSEKKMWSSITELYLSQNQSEKKPLSFGISKDKTYKNKKQKKGYHSKRNRSGSVLFKQKPNAGSKKKGSRNKAKLLLVVNNKESIRKKAMQSTN
tara:strand:- start:4575 stop:5891 length:1317 start_codon:yes stop_codon:yes gene_type:complete